MILDFTYKMPLNKFGGNHVPKGESKLNFNYVLYFLLGSNEGKDADKAGKGQGYWTGNSFVTFYLNPQPSALMLVRVLGVMGMHA